MLNMKQKRKRKLKTKKHTPCIMASTMLPKVDKKVTPTDKNIVIEDINDLDNNIIGGVINAEFEGRL